MTDRPIIFSAPMVRALLEGRKTQTRRLVRHNTGIPVCDGSVVGARFPYATGDRLYVREALTRQETDQGVGYQTYAADGSKVWPLTEWHHRRNSVPSIHMPRWASRLTLTVTHVRVQRLQQISDEDAVAEGVDKHFYDGELPQYRGSFGWKDYRDHPHAVVPFRSPVASFQTLWNSLHGAGAWDENPWVVALTFTVQRGNIDEARNG